MRSVRYGIGGWRIEKYQSAISTAPPTTATIMLDPLHLREAEGRSIIWFSNATVGHVRQRRFGPA